MCEREGGRGDRKIEPRLSERKRESGGQEMWEIKQKLMHIY